jgi:hypothetical protein
MVLKYHGALHRYIQTKMYFVDISSLGISYGYAIKTEHKFRHQNKWEFGSANLQKPKYGKDFPSNQPPKIHPSHRKKRVI